MPFLAPDRFVFQILFQLLESDGSCKRFRVWRRIRIDVIVSSWDSPALPFFTSHRYSYTVCLALLSSNGVKKRTSTVRMAAATHNATRELTPMTWVIPFLADPAAEIHAILHIETQNAISIEFNAGKMVRPTSKKSAWERTKHGISPKPPHPISARWTNPKYGKNQRY